MSNVISTSQLTEEQRSDEVPPKYFTPLSNNVSLRILRGPNQTKGGLIIPHQANWLTPVCQVVATGPDCKWVKRGDKVLVFTSIETFTVRYDFGGPEPQELYHCAETAIYGKIDELGDSDDAKTEGTA